MERKSPFGKITALALSLVMTACAVNALPGSAAGNSGSFYPITPADSDMLSYARYLDEYGSCSRPDCSVTTDGSSFLYAEDGVFSTGSFGSGDDVRDDVLIWESPEGSIGYDIDIPETGLYCLGIDYFPLTSTSPQIVLSMTVDGKTPYDTAERLTLNRVWVNEEDIRTDSRGNQIRPAQVQDGMWMSCPFGDIDGLSAEPLMFFLEKGHHQIGFTSERAELVISRLSFYTPAELPDYEEYRSSFGNDDNASGLIRIEGEDARYKSDATLYPTGDNTGYSVSPSDPVKVVYNTLGADNWKKALQSVTWSIPAEDIGQGGWFRLGIKARQNKMRGFCSNRRVYIDGQVPCRELDCVSFSYDTDWSVTVPRSENGDEIFVFLEGGTDHTITMECVPGEIGQHLRRLETAVNDLNRCYRSIVMITGPDPDKYTDYYVHEKLPELTGELDRISGEMRAVQREIEALSGGSGSEAACLDTAAVILDKCVKKPLRIPSYVSQIKDSVTSVSAFLRDCRDQPLEIDYIEFAASDTQLTDCREKFGKSLMFGLRSFFGSFFEDYTTLSDITGEDAVEVWVALGRDQAQAVKEMTENEFIPQYGIPVSVNLVTGGIVEASLAGKGPDAALFLGGEFPVNLAARGLLTDVSQFDGFEETKGQFGPDAMIHYQYGNGTYGLPVSRSFPMMFYRTDILSELGFTSPPETWQELIYMLPAIQRSYMNVGLVLPPNNISPATESGHTFALLMLQKGLSYYNSDLTATNFSSTAAVQSFEEWTDFYTKYSFEQTYDAFSRFRTGEYPIVIANYTFANQLTAASPEIKGLWDFCPVPGTLRSDGTVSHAANSNGAGAVIFSKAANQEGAWEYIKWFTSADTQTRFAIRTEGLLGTLGRFDTANTEALSRLSWSAEELRRLNAQQSQLSEIPIIPASYAVTRNIMNAFRETINLNENPRDTLIWYNKDINEEILRKSKFLNEQANN